MRLLAFSDLHRDREQAQRLVDRAQDVDVVVGAGDFATMHEGLDGVIETLSAITAPAVLVPGNGETDTELRQASAGWSSCHVLHGEGMEIEGAQFFGLGGGIPPLPFQWSFDLSEDEAAAKLESCPEGAILVVHSPPRGHVDENDGRHMGSEAILTAIERTRPVLVVCGHIHACWGQESRIGATRVVNLGPDGTFLEI
jgi:uncharacterized protein